MDKVTIYECDQDLDYLPPKFALDGASWAIEVIALLEYRSTTELDIC